MSGLFSPQATPVISLNAYLPPLRPGHYRVAALARKQVLTNRGPMGSTYGYADPAQYAVSNIIDLEVVAASPEWIAQAIAASVASLKGAEPNGPEAWEARRAAAGQLRFLDTPAAWRASLDLLPVEEGTLLEGLLASRQPARICELMQSAVAAPGQAVSSYYLDNLSRICAHAYLPAPGASQPQDLKRWNEEGQTRFILRLHSSLRRWQLLHRILKQPRQQIHRAFEGTGSPLYKDAQTKRHRLPPKPQDPERGDETRTTNQNIHS